MVKVADTGKIMDLSATASYCDVELNMAHPSIFEAAATFESHQ